VAKTSLLSSRKFHNTMTVLIPKSNSSFQLQFTGEIFRYEHLPYKFIRVLTLEPGFLGSPIRGRLINVPLFESPELYEALSYSWGQSMRENIIYIDGKPFRVANNLFEALHNLRRTISSRVLWIDAICINQDNMAEKSTQVMLMPEIYRNARTVQIWLGQATVFTAFGVRVLSFLAGKKEIPVAAFSTPLEPFTIGAKEIKGLEDILSRPWFERGWVVQEAALSKKTTLNIGHMSLSWDESSSFRFLKRIKFAEITPRWREEIKIDMRNLRELLELRLRTLCGYPDGEESHDLLDVVHEMRHRKVTCPKDSIYSVLALARDGRDFEVDYRNSVEETFRRLYHYTRLKYKDQWESGADMDMSNPLHDTWYWLCSHCW
jgi:hypothetical protein